MVGLIVNIDVPDLDAGTAFYTAALGLTAGRRFDGFAELLGLEAPLYLIEAEADGTLRRYDRHWTPVHLDIAVDDLDAATARAEAAGAIRESGPRDDPYGRIATFADPFGHGFCLIAFNESGYDALA